MNSDTLLHGQQTILIVDDTPANLGVLVEQLDEQRFQVVVAQDGEEGIQRAGYVLPDIILLDVMMPGMDGFEVCSKLKEDERTRDIPVIFMTALTETRNKLKGFDAGGVDYITKPFQIEEVVARINTHLKLCTMQRQLIERNRQLQEEVRSRKQAEAALCKTLQEQQRLLEHAGVGIAFLQDRRLMRCNQKLASLLGYEMDALEGETLENLYAIEPAEDSATDTCGQAFVKPEEGASDIRYRRRDGSRFWGETIVTAIDRDSPSQGEILVIHDIEQRKSSEALRSGQGQLFEMLVKDTPLDEVLSSLIRLVGSQMDDVLAAIFLVEGEQWLNLSAGSEFPEALYLEYKKCYPKGEPIAEDSSPNGAAACQRKSIWVDDMTQAKQWADYCKLGVPHGLRGACLSTPILASQGKLAGVLTLYFRKSVKRNRIDMQVVDMATRIAAIAIERQQTDERIQFMAYHDALTGLPNRALLEDRLNLALLMAQRYKRQLSVIFIDLDHFKLINDSLGHKCGDELLKVVAQRLKESVRRTDTVVRQGGDEFIVILYDIPTPTQVGEQFMKKMREAIVRPIHLSGHDLRVTCSMGMATYPQDGDDMETLLRNADTAMYRAKELGRNNYQTFCHEMDSEAQSRLMLQEELRHALENNELVLYYQAQYGLNSQTIIGMEALLRWQHPKLGLIPPARFIQLAESSGLIVPIGDWVLHTACKQNKTWQDAGMAQVCVSVNVSPRQFHEEDLPERVAKALEVSGLEACYLELELTESLVMKDPQQAVETMNKLNDMGVQLSIDDFGTGYSSLSALKRFPVTRLKIDRSFVNELPGSLEDSSIAEAVISLGHSLNLKVIAEGVEELQQVEFLSNHACDEIQGYYFSRPIPAGEFEQFLQTLNNRRFDLREANWL
ncbi:EAL domain-containing protein [uncultured Desulfobacter sp.]|uniref:EAL domain-containing protein n=1 Tax=uncultured Desulfobacter sp. TaxID=240139 RepID=UPI002AA95331|nr:EAL domain-containing protein [uncultured Desulfobacter sp.]